MDSTPAFDLVAHLHRQRAFSLRTFGPGPRTQGVSDHIRKELREVRAAPRDLEEWTDIVLLSFDGALRSGGAPESIAGALGGVVASLPALDLVEHLRAAAAEPTPPLLAAAAADALCRRIDAALDRVAAAPEALERWIAVVRLAFEGALGCGAAPEAVAGAIGFKLGKNERRSWPDWRTADPGKAIEHVRSESEAAAAAALRDRAPVSDVAAAGGGAPAARP